MTGIELIAKERQEQIEKHGKTVSFDAAANPCQQLLFAAGRLLHTDSMYYSHMRNYPPDGWCEGKKQWKKMMDKPLKERIIIAGALLAAEIDRLNYSYIEDLKNQRKEYE